MLSLLKKRFKVGISALQYNIFFKNILGNLWRKVIPIKWVLPQSTKTDTR